MLLGGICLYTKIGHKHRDPFLSENNKIVITGYSKEYKLGFL